MSTHGGAVQHRDELAENPAFFAQVRGDEDAGTIVWPNRAGIPVTVDAPTRIAR
jgi:hypothetical protein